MVSGVELSVVVMSFRNSGTVERAVGSLVDQRTSRSYEIILVASGGDASAELIASKYPDVRVIEVEERLSPGGTRNRGVAASKGDVVAFLAADCLAGPDWVAARLRAHDAGHPVVAGAVTNGSRGVWSWAGHYALFANRSPGWPSRVVRFPEPAAHSLSYRRDVLEPLLPVPEDFAVAEDTEMARRLMEAGVRIWFENTVRIAHLGGTGRAVLSDQWRRGMRLGREEVLRISRTSRFRAYLTFAELAFTRCCWVTGGTWRGSAGDRLRLIAVLPLLWTCAIAYQLGWLSEQKRLRTSSEVDPERAKLFAAVQEERDALRRRGRAKRRRREAPPVAPTND